VSESLADIVKRAFPSGVPAVGLPSYKTDPVAWVRDMKPKVERKDAVISVFEPWLYQEDVMRYFWEGGTFIIDKSRQMGFTTALLFAVAHALLYYIEGKGYPLHFHLISDSEKKSKALLRKVKLALSTSEDGKRAASRRWLRGHDPEAGNDEVKYNPRTGGGGDIIAFNSALAHPTTGGAVRGYDGNSFLIEEAGEIGNLEEVFRAAHAMLIRIPKPPGWVVSTPTYAAHPFTEMCENPPGNAIHLSYRSEDLVPGHDRDAEIAWMGEDNYMIEQGLKVAGEGSPVFDMTALKRFADAAVPLGTQPLPGHRYSSAVDNSGPGQDEATWVTSDITARPAQPVYEEILPRGSQEKKVRIAELWEQWGGNVNVDGTYDPSFVVYLRKHFMDVGLPEKTIRPINMTGGDQYNKRKDASEPGLIWTCVPRKRLVSGAKHIMENGRVVVVREQTPKLWDALRTASHPRVTKARTMESPQAAKRRGKYPDVLDAGMMSLLPVMPRHAIKGDGTVKSGVVSLGKVEPERKVY